MNMPSEFWATLAEMAPYLLFGFLVAGALSVLVSPEFVERHLGGRGLWPIVKASAFGVPLPLCSCGVIPVAASLRRHGASRGATTAFLISTPQDGVDSVLVTLSLLGPVFAIFRPIVALVSGFLGGVLVGKGADGQTGDAPPAKACADACCASEEHGKVRRALTYGFGALPRDIGRTLLIGLVVAALISAAVPEDFFGKYLGQGKLLTMLVMMAVAIPVYVCATASVPVAAALIAAGISPGGALVFLMTGPATNIATISTVWKVMGKKTALIYLATVAVSALAAGLALDYIFQVTHITPKPGMPWMIPSAVKTASAIALLAVLGYAVIHPLLHKHKHIAAPTDRGQTVTLEISGMTCTHCAGAIERALRECPGVQTAVVDFDAHLAEIAGESFDVSQLTAAVKDAGYEAKPAPED